MSAAKLDQRAYSPVMEGARRLLEAQLPCHGDPAIAAKALGITAPQMFGLRRGVGGPLTTAWQAIYAKPEVVSELLDVTGEFLLTDLLACVLPVIFAPVKAAGSESWARFCRALAKAALRIGGTPRG